MTLPDVLVRCYWSGTPGPTEHPIMPIQLKFHGALNEVTGSTTFFRLTSTGSVYAVDCGSAHRRKASDEPAHPDNLPAGCKPTQLKGLFLTHAHADHIGMLIHWVKAGFKGPIYCTAETARFAFHACDDSHRILLRDHPKTDVTEAHKVEAQRLLTGHIPLTPGGEAEIEPGLAVGCYPTSHIMGCVGYQFSAVDAAGKPTRVFFTGDVGTVEDEAETRSMMRTRVRPRLPSDYVITESTYGDRQREQADRSGRARLDRLAQVLERGFRHGTDAKVFFPAFSLQRCQDLLLDIFHVLGFNRAATGLAAGVVPKVYLDSRLASLFMEVFSDVYRAGTDGSSPWVNPSASFFDGFNGDVALCSQDLEKLLRFGDPGSCVRLYPGGEAFEVFCGSPREGAQGPMIVLCGSGMTNNGAIQRYLYDHAQDPSATFVISGYVPAKSPGAALLKLAELSAEKRASLTLELKGDPKRNDQPKNLFGGEIKSDCVSISRFYSGHADGASLCRYVLGDDAEGVPSLKRVFLIHGEDVSRAGLKSLLEDRFRRASPPGGRLPAVECPHHLSPWFDCGSGRWSGEEAVVTSLAVLVPASDDILDVALSVFDPREITHDSGQGILTIKANQASSRTSLRVKTFNDTHHKLIAETTYAEVQSLLEAGRVAFRWREVLNALQIQKSEYFAGHKLCANEQEFQEFESMRRNLILEGRQRVNGFVVAGRNAFGTEELAALEALLTPHVPFFVLDNRYLSRLNAALFSNPDQPTLSKSRAFYVPVKVVDPFVPISSPYDWECLRNLLVKVAADAKIKEARRPARPASSKAVVGSTAREAAPVVSNGGIPAERAAIPEVAYAGLCIGQRVAVTVEAPFANGKAKGMKLRVNSSGALGVIYGVHYLGGAFDHPLGSTIEVYVRMVEPSQRRVEFVLVPPVRKVDASVELAAARGTVTWARMAELLHRDIKTLAGLVADYCKLVVDDRQSVVAEGLVPAGSELIIYEKIARELEKERSRRNNLPPASEPFTMGKMAGILGGEWKSTDVLHAARYLEGAPQETVVRMAQTILSSSPTGAEGDVFPLEHKDLFYAACVEASEARWAAVPPVKSEPPARPLPEPSCHALRELAALWGVSPATLMLEAEALGLGLRAEIVLTQEEAARLGSGPTA